CHRPDAAGHRVWRIPAWDCRASNEIWLEWTPRELPGARTRSFDACRRAAWDPVSSGSQTAGDQLSLRVEREPGIENAARPLMPMGRGNADRLGRDLRAAPKSAP